MFVLLLAAVSIRLLRLLLLLCVQMLAHHFDLHPLAVEDVLHFQRIKAVTYSGALHCVSAEGVHV
jgi:hypothetical protein